MMKLGRPEQFLDKVGIRLKAIDRAIAQYQFSANTLKKPLEKNVDEHTSLYLKGLGNEINLLSALRELFFNSRELLEVLLGWLSRLTAKSKSQTPKDFIPFSKRLMRGDFDHFELPIFDFLKTNITYIFHIRKIRNEIKSDPASIEFLYNTNHFEARLPVPIESEEVELIQYLDISNRDEALQNKYYGATYNLDVLFPEIREFWNTALAIYRESEAVLTSRSSKALRPPGAP
jgi:hypothetical protein